MSNFDRKVKRKKTVREDEKKIKYRNALLSQGIPEKEVDKLIRDNPTAVNDSLTYEEVVKGYDIASLSIKYNQEILGVIANMDVVDGVDKVKHAELLTGVNLNQDALKEDHLSILDVVTEFREKTGEVQGHDLIAMLEISAMAGLTQNTTLQIQEAIFLNLAINVNLDIENMAGLE